MAEGAWHEGRVPLWASACSRFTDLGVFDLTGPGFYRLTNSLRDSTEEGHPPRPSEVFVVLHGHVRDLASKYLDEETLEESMGDLPFFLDGSLETPEPVAGAWAEVGRDIWEASEQLRGSRGMGR